MRVRGQIVLVSRCSIAVSKVGAQVPIARRTVECVDVSHVAKLIPLAIPEKAFTIFKAPLNESIIIINELTKVFGEFYFHEEQS
jgi:hypothetical protein